MQHGWPGDNDHNSMDDLIPFKRRKTELSAQDGFLLWVSHVVIPPQILF